MMSIAKSVIEKESSQSTLLSKEYFQHMYYGHIAKEQARSGDYHSVQKTIDLIEGKEWRSSVQLDIIQISARNGNMNQAQKMAKLVTEPWDKARASPLFSGPFPPSSASA